MYSLFKPHFRVDEVLEEIKECLEKGWTGLGYKTVEFEEQWKELFGFSNAHFLNSNTSGLFLCLEILRDRNLWGGDAEVISTPITFVATNHAIKNAGLRVVFAEVDESLNMSPESVKERINENTKAIVFVGIGGNTKNFEEVCKIAKERGVSIILDAAHMAGSFLEHRHVGLNADCTIFSFQAVKNLPSADSGMICFKRADLDAIARKRSWLGISKDTYERTNSQTNYKWDYDVELVSNKYHGNSIMASMCMVGARYLLVDNARRRRIFGLYADLLSGSDSFSLIRHEESVGTFSSQHLIQVILNKDWDRDEVMVGLNNRGVYPGVHYKCNSLFTPYAELSSTVQFSEGLSRRIISLPNHLGLSDEDVTFIGKQLVEVCG